MDQLPVELSGALSMFDVASNDPDGRLVDRSAITEADLDQIGELMNALGGLRTAERRMSEASQHYMQLNETDMRALHFLIIAKHADELVTPGRLADHLGISTASTTKLLDRLEHGNHVERSPHPTDRRALVVTIMPDTHRAARESVGRQQARRVFAAARLTTEERDVVIRFLRDMTADMENGEAESSA